MTHYQLKSLLVGFGAASVPMPEKIWLWPDCYIKPEEIVTLDVNPRYTEKGREFGIALYLTNGRTLMYDNGEEFLKQNNLLPQ
jgi:hypothetical protein